MNIKLITKKRFFLAIFILVAFFIAFSFVRAKNKPVEVKTSEASVRNIIKTISL